MAFNFTDKKTARIAGLLYLAVVLTGIFSLAYVPKTLFEWDDPALTFHNITASETLFRLGILSSIVCYISFLFMPMALYKLLKPVQAFYAGLMVVLAAASVPISLVNLQNKFAVLSLIGKDSYLRAYSAEQLQGQTMFYLNQYDHGILLASVFWELWLLPFGYLVYKSGFLPRALGILLMLGCLGYLINFSGNMLIENYGEIGISKFIALPATLGEIGICLWLLIIGTKQTDRSILKKSNAADL
ncbi:DUF4386 domain-containing protein [Flavobacterium sp. UW10123]|uniref:DUF4386 domain-containing protein n=1 Tax=Flavobacterium sp. UW10123 TaxID=3230800 RepID=UPI003395718B